MVESVRIIGGFNFKYLFKWIDSSYDVHPNILIQTVGFIPMGCGMLRQRSSKQNLNEKSST